MTVDLTLLGPHAFMVCENARGIRNEPKDGRLVRLHQEDFAQALGVPSQRKYASEDGSALPKRAINHSSGP